MTAILFCPLSRCERFGKELDGQDFRVWINGKWDRIVCLLGPGGGVIRSLLVAGKTVRVGAMKFRPDLVKKLTPEMVQAGVVRNTHRYKSEPLLSKTGVGSLSTA